jgi:hypothetical protein
VVIGSASATPFLAPSPARLTTSSGPITPPLT